MAKNRISSSGTPYVVIELGDVLRFDDGNQRVDLELTHFENERPFSGTIDLIQFEQETKISPIVVEK